MRALVALNPDMLESIKYSALKSINMGGLEILLGLVDFDDPVFEREDSKNDNSVLIKVNAFSCNYRDKGILVYNYNLMRETKRLFVPFGSEFCGTVIDKGNNVSEFEIGDQVIPDCSYEDMTDSEIPPGVVTNFASLGWLRVNKNKIVKKPMTFTESEGACFSLGAQTAASMIRKSEVLKSKTKKPIIFSACSSTSLFVAQQLKAYGINPICISKTKNCEKYPVDTQWDTINNISKYFSSMSHAFDPFFDLNILNAVNSLMMGGKYLYCGMLEQHPQLAVKDISEYENDIREAMKLNIIKNASIIGNCLGEAKDLKDAIHLYEDNNIKPIIDKEFFLDEGTEFLERSFNGRGKIGKCVIVCD